MKGFCRNCGNVGCTVCVPDLYPEIDEHELDALLDIIEHRLLEEPSGTFGIRTRTGAVILVHLAIRPGGFDIEVDPENIRIFDREVAR